jgi:hypothetical protein
VNKIIGTLRGASSLVLIAAALFGCESIALIGRPTLESRGQPRDITATVNGIDAQRREIYLRAGSNQHYVVNYTDDTRMMIDGREQAVNGLQVGDQVRVNMREGEGRRLIADQIRVESRGVAGASGIRTVEGTVERVMTERRVLELRTPNGDLLTIYVPDWLNDAAKNRFQRIRAGDYVRLEGERLSEYRMELVAFL